MGIVYLIKCDLDKESNGYVGQTAGKLNIRWNNHKTKFKYFAAGNMDNTYCTALCKAVMKYNITNFTITKIDECNDSDLDAMETNWINKLNTLYPNGYNVYTGGYSKGNNARIVKNETREIISSIGKSNKSKELNLPMYINFAISKNGNMHGYKVYHSPSKKQRDVMTPIDKPITDIMLQKAKDILNNLIDIYESNLIKNVKPIEEFEPVPFQYVEKTNKLPTYINIYNRKSRVGDRLVVAHGYKVLHLPSKKSKYFMTSIDKPITNSMLEDAKEYLKLVIDKYNSTLVNNLENLKIQ